MSRSRVVQLGLELLRQHQPFELYRCELRSQIAKILPDHQGLYPFQHCCRLAADGHREHGDIDADGKAYFLMHPCVLERSRRQDWHEDVRRRDAALDRVGERGAGADCPIPDRDPSDLAKSFGDSLHDRLIFT